MTRLLIKKTALLAIAIFSCSTIYSQSITDGLRYSQTLNGGTARFVSMGGAFGALGADFSSISINPAGAGVYKSSEFTITPTFKHRNISSTYDGLSASENKNKLNLDNLGFLMSFKPYKSEEKGILSFNIGFGYNRTNDFYSNSIAKGYYDNHSIIDYWANQATQKRLTPGALTYTNSYEPFNELGSSDWPMIMAWDTWLLFGYNAGSQSFESALFPNDSVDHENSISTKGGAGEYDISFSMNVSNKLFLGATIGVTDFNYTFNSSYSEFAKESNPADIDGNKFYSMVYNQFYETKGTGYNFKIGAIYNPIPSIRIGASVHTPSFYSFEDTYSSAVKSDFDTSGIQANFSSKTPLGRYEYDFETPFKVIGSFAYVIKNIGLISVDVEHMNYSSMKFRNGGDGYNFTDENLAIEKTYKSVTNVRIGGEYKIQDFAIRAGYAYYPSPYKKGYLNEDSNTTQISGGFGYRSGNFSIDMAYLHTVKNESYVFYDYPNLPQVDTKMKDGKVLVTFGFRF